MEKQMFREVIINQRQAQLPNRNSYVPENLNFKPLVFE